MGIAFEILGEPGRDNALFLRIDSGQSVDRLLFDCGDGCLGGLSFSEIQSIDHLFFSHLHMDHIGGFDQFFRSLFDRTSKPNRIWGPANTSAILQHRFQGFLWNLHSEMNGSWTVTDVTESDSISKRFELAEAFAVVHDVARQTRPKFVVETMVYTVEAHIMDHRTPTLAYAVREKPRSNIDQKRVSEMGLKPGAWMKRLKDPSDPSEAVIIDDRTFSIAELRSRLVVETPGDSIAYLTDFLLDDDTITRLGNLLEGCGTIVCEGQYRHSDLELAQKNFHMTTMLSARLALQSKAKKLVLFHLSDRYNAQEWLEMLAEAKQIFPAASFPSHWQLS
ncbi:MAG: ribonuclease Z [Planctomycetes bacterium]|nr:ribonuclease Z [Planctomycetota bacterium]